MAILGRWSGGTGSESALEIFPTAYFWSLILLEQINITIFTCINQFAGNQHVVDVIAVGVAEYLPYLFIMTLLYLWFSSDSEIKQSVLYAGYSTIIALLINLLITLLYFHPRPFMLNIGETLFEHVPESSFPSDHTTFMLSIAIMLLTSRVTRVFGFTLVFGGLFGGVSRVFCGVHFPGDILGAIVVSVLAASIVLIFKEKLRPINNYVISLYEKVTIKQRGCN